MAAARFKAAPVADPSGGKSYAARGVVRQITADRRKVTIRHEVIAGYMPAMTMKFPVKDTNELAGISASDEITFQLVVRENDDWIEGVRFVARPAEDVADAAGAFQIPAAELKPGELLPDDEFTTEDGGKIHFSDFRGKAVALTFFFSRCPLPDYCPRLAGNFLAARKLILATSNAPANWQMLSISFDPGFDNPEVLSSYAGFFREGDTNRWLFAAASTNTLSGLAPRLNLIVRPDGAGITHNLRTVVLDPHGRIFRQFDGNSWTPPELADAMLKAARQAAR